MSKPPLKPTVHARAVGLFATRSSSAAKPTVQIFTHRLCQEVDGVIDELRRLNVSIERINLCQFPGILKLTMEDGTNAAPLGGGAGWIHDLSSFSFETELTGLAREVALKESNAFIDGLLLRQNCNWLNSPCTIHLASNKPYQLHLATKLGIKVPPYLITNDSRMLRRFQREQGAIVIKTLSAAFIRYGKKSLKFYTRRIGSLSDEVMANLSLSPVIAQKEIRRTHEIRITVVDGQCYSVAVNCRNLPLGVVDIRQLDYVGERHRFELLRGLKGIERQSINFVKALGLNYAGLDWAVSLSGDAFLFEANPLASFKWFELVGAGNITTAVATALHKRLHLFDREETRHI
jgi:hypothetical protein